MANYEEATLASKIIYKNSQGILENPVSYGITFDNVIERKTTGEDLEGVYTLKQFFDDYKAFMKQATFVYKGNEEPTNPSIGIWLDTSVDPSI